MLAFILLIIYKAFQFTKFAKFVINSRYTVGNINKLLTTYMTQPQTCVVQ